MKIKNQYRQGDILVDKVKAIPASANLTKTNGRAVLAEGEATGHCHTIDHDPKTMDVFLEGSQLYLHVKAPVVLRHQEHAFITIDPGDYIVRRQVEVWLDEVRQVKD